MNALKHSEREYVAFDPFFGDEAEISCRAIKLVIVRKAHSCLFGLNGDGHRIEPGNHARYEKALIDGDYWVRYYLYIPCLDREISAMRGGAR